MRGKEKPLRFTVTGQSLIEDEMKNSSKNPSYLSLIEHIQKSDLAFTNFEGNISPGSGSGPLDDLKWMGFNLLSLANNHAAETGIDNMMFTKECAESMGFCTAGTGRTLEEATQPSYIEVSGCKIALIAMDTANLQTKDAIAGVNGKPGVNPLRGVRESSTVIHLNTDDVERNLEAIRKASNEADYVFVSLHEHFWHVEWKDITYEKHWPEEWKHILQWKQDFTRKAVDAGASAVICHGLPSMCAIEIYKNKPIFYSAGNFIFHLSLKCWFNEEVWEGCIIDVILENCKVKELQLIPIVLVDRNGVSDVPNEFRRFPAVADKERSKSIIERIAYESSVFGTKIEWINGMYRVKLDI
ncbi:MAG TPA: CapA family protein [Clostridiaceae bacterium]|nr:CapA family protein [Clostridiaceae bacterium]